MERHLHLSKSGARAWRRRNHAGTSLGLSSIGLALHHSQNSGMTNGLQIVYLARHGETAWSLTGQHKGLTDLPLTERGRQNALALRERLLGLNFERVITSPLQRARCTCELAGFGPAAEVDRDLLEWNYGEYEGRRTADIHAKRPDWQLFRDGCPGGESPEQVGARADRVVTCSRTARNGRRMPQSARRSPRAA